MLRGCVLVPQVRHVKSIATLLVREMEFRLANAEGVRIALEIKRSKALEQFLSEQPETPFKRRVFELRDQPVTFFDIRHRIPIALRLEEMHDFTLPGDGAKFGNAILYPNDNEARRARIIFMGMQELYAPVRTFPSPFPDEPVREFVN